MVSAKERNENVSKLECSLVVTSSWQISVECVPWLVGKNTILGLSIVLGLSIYGFLVTQPFLYRCKNAVVRRGGTVLTHVELFCASPAQVSVFLKIDYLFILQYK